MDLTQMDEHDRNQQIASLIVGRSATDSGHIVNKAHCSPSQEVQKARDNAVIEAQLHLSTILGEDVGSSSFAHQTTFPKARHIIGGHVKFSQITTCFESGMQSRQYLQRLNTHDAVRESADSTIPINPEHKRALVGVLVQAFKSTANAKDKPKFLESFAEKRYDNRLVEARCWQILEFCIERSKRQALLRLWGGDKTKSECVNVRDMQFADRYDAVVNVLGTWKKSCDRVYQAPFIPQLVDNPDWTMKQSISNAVSNDRKATLLDIAKQAEEETVEQYSSPATTTPSPTKRRKTVTTPSSSRRGSIRTPRSKQATDRALQPRFPSLSQHSSSYSASPFSNGSLLEGASPTGTQHHNPTSSADPLSSQSSQPYLRTQSSAPAFGLSTAGLGYHGDGNIDNNMAFNQEIFCNTPGDRQTNHLTNPTDLTDIFGLGSWQDPFATPTSEPEFIAADADPRHFCGQPGRSRRSPSARSISPVFHRSAR